MSQSGGFLPLLDERTKVRTRVRSRDFKLVKRTGRGCLAGRLLPLGHESRYVGVGWPRVGLPLGQKLVEMAAPSGGVGAVVIDVAQRPGRIQYCLDAAPFRQSRWRQALDRIINDPTVSCMVARDSA